MTSRTATLLPAAVDHFWEQNGSPVSRSSFVYVQRMPDGPVARCTIGEHGAVVRCEQLASSLGVGAERGWGLLGGTSLVFEPAQAYGLAWTTLIHSGEILVADQLAYLLALPHYRVTPSAQELRARRLVVAAIELEHLQAFTPPGVMGDGASNTQQQTQPQLPPEGTPWHGPYSFSLPPGGLDLTLDPVPVGHYFELADNKVTLEFQVEVARDGQQQPLSALPSILQQQIYQSKIHGLAANNQITIDSEEEVAPKPEISNSAFGLGLQVSLPQLQHACDGLGMVSGLHLQFTLDVFKREDDDGKMVLHVLDLVSELTVASVRFPSIRIEGLGWVRGTFSLKLSTTLRPRWARLAAWFARRFGPRLVRKALQWMVDDAATVVADAVTGVLVGGAEVVLATVVCGAVCLYAIVDVIETTAATNELADDVEAQLFAFCCGYSRTRRGLSAPSPRQLGAAHLFAKYQEGVVAASEDMSRALEAMPQDQFDQLINEAQRVAPGREEGYLLDQLAARDAARIPAEELYRQAYQSAKGGYKDSVAQLEGARQFSTQVHVDWPQLTVDNVAWGTTSDFGNVTWDTLNFRMGNLADKPGHSYPSDPPTSVPFRDFVRT